MACGGHSPLAGREKEAAASITAAGVTRCLARCTSLRPLCIMCWLLFFELEASRELGAVSENVCVCCPSRDTVLLGAWSAVSTDPEKRERCTGKRYCGA